MAFNSQSQPIGDVAGITVGTGPSQQVTLVSGTIYGGVEFVVGWEGSTRPDQVLTIEVRHGAGAATGGGTLDAATAIPASRLTSSALRLILSNFAATFTSTSAQYYVFFRSSASAGRRWVVGRVDVVDATVTGVSTANVESCGIGAGTDSYADTSGTAVPRYDIPVALVSAASSSSFVLPSGSATLVAAA